MLFGVGSHYQNSAFFQFVRLEA